MDVGEQRDLSGHWNDVDARQVADTMIVDCLARPWIASFSQTAGRRPMVTVGTIRNQSMEHINTDVFVEAIERALINSDRVGFVAAHSERQDLRAERLDQDRNASDGTRKSNGEESGADYLLSGTVNAVQDRLEGETVVFYQINMKLLDVKTNSIVWNGQDRIKKSIVRSSVTW